ncbi:helix-turn-helix domain-containing protein [Clostridium botulinum C]|nr:helix-turn-helix domain-containing protein [Clostridium botulinum C]
MYCERWNKLLELKFELRIKEFRLFLGISQKNLARKAKLSQGYIAKLESKNRTKSPTLNTIYLIAQVFKVCPFDLVTCNGNCDTCKLKKI